MQFCPQRVCNLEEKKGVKRSFQRRGVRAGCMCCSGEKQGAMAVPTRQTWLSSGKACQGGNTYTGTRGGVFQVEGAAMRKGPEVEEELRS